MVKTVMKVMKDSPVKGPVPEFITMTSKDLGDFAEKKVRQGIEAGRKLENFEMAHKIEDFQKKIKHFQKL